MPMQYQQFESLVSLKGVKLTVWLEVIRQCKASELTNQHTRKSIPTYHPNISHNNRKINHQIVSSELLL